MGIKMGKIQKIKADRKRQEVAAQIKKIKRNKLIAKSFVSACFLVLIVALGYYGYQNADRAWSFGDKINKLKKEYLTKNENKDPKEDKVARKTYSKAPEMQIDLNKSYLANFETSEGGFTVELFTKDAPKTVNNFVVLSRDGFYDGLTFHRVIQDFMIQGGDPDGVGTGGPGYKFEDEFNQNKLVRGTLAMANSGPNTNGSQFFIVTAEKTEWLDGKHTAFGKVTEGLENVLKIEKTPVGENDKPNSPVIISKITISEK